MCDIWLENHDSVQRFWAACCHPPLSFSLLTGFSPLLRVKSKIENPDNLQVLVFSFLIFSMKALMGQQPIKTDRITNEEYKLKF